MRNFAAVAIRNPLLVEGKRHAKDWHHFLSAGSRHESGGYQMDSPN
jgi:hypothetical protein